MAKVEKDDYYTMGLDRCTKCGSHDVKSGEIKNKINQRITTVFCRKCKSETRRRLAI